MLNLSRSVFLYGESVNWESDEVHQMAAAAEPDNGDEKLFTVWEFLLVHLDAGERMVFLTVSCIICGFGAIGNVMTLIVMFTRKQRLLFKVCLLSLSISDLLYLAATGSNYITKLARENSVLWILGPFGCTAIPFIQTSTILISSMSLVTIALDRYFAVLNVSKSPLLQRKLFCFSGVLLIWLLSCAVSSPTLFSYKYRRVYVVPNEDLDYFYLGHVCITNTDELAVFYITMFTFIFFPIFVAFVWLNAIIATEIWKRRHAPGAQTQSKPKKADDDTSTMEMKATDETNTSSNVRNNSSKVSSGESKNSTAPAVFTVDQPQIDTRRNENQRQRRQMRMFKVILVLMFAFIICRLPNWIFLLYKLSYSVTGSLNLRLMYSFGLLGLLNCMLNPLLYTFLSETIRITARIGSFCYKFCKLCRPKRTTTSHYANNQTLFPENGPRKSDGGIYLGA